MSLSKSMILAFGNGRDEALRVGDQTSCHGERSQTILRSRSTGSLALLGMTAAWTTFSHNVIGEDRRVVAVVLGIMKYTSMRSAGSAR